MSMNDPETPLTPPDPSHFRDYMTFREAVTMFVSKADFQAAVGEIKSSIKDLGTDLKTIKENQLPKWFWVICGAIVGPIIAALGVHLLSKFWP